MRDLILAQIPAASHEMLLTVLIGGAAVMAMVLLLLSIVEKVRNLFTGKRTINVQPVETQPVSQSQLDKVETLLRSEQKCCAAECRERMTLIENEQKRIVSELHEKINRVDRGVARICGKLGINVEAVE